MKKLMPVLAFLLVLQTPLQGNVPFWPGFNTNILMSQVSLASPSVLDPVLPSVALYSIQGSDRAIFNPEYLQEAVLGLAFNDAADLLSTANESETATSLSNYSDINSTVGCGCYVGGFGGVAGNGSSGAGGGDFSYYAASSDYSMDGMGFGGGGGGGGNPPTDVPPPIRPPPPVVEPEPTTWLTLVGALGAVLLWRRKRVQSQQSK